MGLIYSCRRVSELISQSQDGPFDALDRLQMRLHLRLCGNCSTVERQLTAVHAMAGELFGAGADDEAATPPAAAVLGG